jgi:hypothetical protein
MTASLVHLFNPVSEIKIRFSVLDDKKDSEKLM